MASQFDTKSAIRTLSMCLGFAVSIYIAFNSRVSQWFTGHLLVNQRTVLSTLTTNLFGDDSVYEIVKIKDQDMIYLEVYKKILSLDPKLVSKISLNTQNDGYFLFHNSSTNLALNDVDGDKIPEIIAPTFDKNMAAHLNVIKFDKENHTFYLVLSPIAQND